MTIPTFIFGVLVASLFGALFHLVVGGSFILLLVYLITSSLGFWSGNFLGTQLKFSIFMLGPIDLGFSLLGSLVFCLFVYWLSSESQTTIDNNEND